jgi:hypothetical protein
MGYGRNSFLLFPSVDSIYDLTTYVLCHKVLTSGPRFTMEMMRAIWLIRKVRNAIVTIRTL